MRILHTSDWHLDHVLHDHRRENEHEAFLRWLASTLEEFEVDALLISGDIFDSANPTATSTARWLSFLATLRSRLPLLDIVAIGGNHDSAGRMESPSPLLSPLRIEVVGGLPRVDGEPDASGTLRPIHRRNGSVGAWVAAVPFLRPVDLPRLPESDAGPLISGVRRVYEDALIAARKRREPGQALIAMGHCYMVGTALSELSERRILGGNQHALPADIFHEDWAYVALGHLHRAQTVGGRAGLRYSGSPLPLSLSERTYQHAVCLVDLEGEELLKVQEVPVPRTRTMIRIPGKGAAVLPDVLAELRNLPAKSDVGEPEWKRPFLEVRVLLEEPVPDLREQVRTALEGRNVVLASLRTESRGTGAALADIETVDDLRAIDPETVLRRMWERDVGQDPHPELWALVRSLLDRGDTSAQPNATDRT